MEKPTSETAPKGHHFYASSVATWMTSTPECDLQELIRRMTKEKYNFGLWLVPTDWDADYEIAMYAPQVPGAKLLGVFTPGKRSKK